jgi:hypothetical protein
MTRPALAALFACVIVCGCGSLPKPAMPKLAMPDLQAVGLGSHRKLANVENASEVKLTYQTSSDRLNVASGAATLPAATQSILQVDLPHPAGKPDMARVVLFVQPKTKEPSWLDKLRGAESEQPDALETRVFEVPAREVQSIVAELQDERFFERSKPLATDAFVGVEVEGDRFAKDFRSLPELDALVLRAHHQGYALQGPTRTGGLAQAAQASGETLQTAAASVPAAGYPSTDAAVGQAHPTSAFHRLPTVEPTTLR